MTGGRFAPARPLGEKPRHHQIITYWNHRPLHA